MKKQPHYSKPSWLDHKEYPFQSKIIKTSYGKMHYVDEGSGEVILFLHGNPSWSFGYRGLIKHFSEKYRCIAPDHIGFGLSDKPYDVSYSPQFHSENLMQFIGELGLKNITLVVHDWGGPIGMSYALANPRNIKRIITYNSWFWPIKKMKTLKIFSNFMGSPIGRFLCKYLNFFPRFLMRAELGDKKKLPKSIHQHYIKPFPTPRSRKGTWIFADSITAQSDWLKTLWTKRATLTNTPLLLLWGLKDDAFTTKLLHCWENEFPNCTTQTYPNSGHNAPEEIGEDAISPMEQFLATYPN